MGKKYAMGAIAIHRFYLKPYRCKVNIWRLNCITAAALKKALASLVHLSSKISQMQISEQYGRRFCAGWQISISQSKVLDAVK